MNSRFYKTMTLARFNDHEPEVSGDGLMGSGEPQPPEQAPEHQEQPPAAPSQPDGLMATGDADGTKAPGSDPKSVVPEQFINKETGEVDSIKLAESYNNLRAEFNKRLNGHGVAPEDAETYLDSIKGEDGNFVMPEGTDRFREVPTDDPALLSFAEVAKEAGLTDKQFELLVQGTMTKWNDLLPEPLNIDAEREKLGRNATAMINANKAWVDGLAEQGLITDELKGRAYELARDATGIKLMQTFREQAGELKIPTEGAQAFDQPMTQKEWYNMTLESHGKPGEDFQTFMERKAALGEQIFGDAPSGSSPAGMGVPDSSTSHLRHTKKA